MIFGRYCLMISCMISLGLTVNPLKDIIAYFFVKEIHFWANIGFSILILSLISVVSFLITDLGKFLCLTGLFPGIWLVFIFASLLSIKTNYYRKTFLKFLEGLWILLSIAISLYGVFTYFYE